MIFKKNDKVVFFGDSITESEYRRILNNGSDINILGTGFVNLFYGYMNMEYPELELAIINRGISGNRTFEMLERLDNDVISLKPNWCFIMAGINDVCKAFDNYHGDVSPIPAKLKENFKQLLNTLIENKIKVVVLSPFYLDDNISNPRLNLFNECFQIIKNLAIQYNIQFIDMQKPFINLLKKTSNKKNLTNDNVHVKIQGHMLIVKEIIKNI